MEPPLYFSLGGDVFVTELEGSTWSGRRAISEIEPMAPLPPGQDYEPLVRPDGCELFWVRQLDDDHQQVFHATRSPGGSL